jgi:hypothetical protein
MSIAFLLTTLVVVVTPGTGALYTIRLAALLYTSSVTANPATPA